jgi:hypothetical protein
VNAAAKTDLDLRAHPFDRHRLEAMFEVLGFDESEVVMEAASTPVPPGPSWRAAIRMPQWDLTGVGTSIRSHSASPSGELGVASTFVLTMDVERKSLFVIRLVILPLLLVVVMSWSVFWMEQSSVGDRISVSFIGILTVVSFQIILSEILPRISYMTLMNGFLNMSFFVMCATVVVNLRVGWLDRQGDSVRGDRIDRRCRWAFPLVYVLLLLFVSVMTVFAVA